MQVSDTGVEVIKRFEGFRAAAYQDISGNWTIGYGTKDYPDGKGSVKKGDTVTEDQAEQYLYDGLNERLAQVAKFVRPTLNQNRVDALGDFVYNIGTEAFIQSHLLVYINANLMIRAADEFISQDQNGNLTGWIHSGGKIVDALVSRRVYDKSLWLVPANMALSV